MIVISVFLSAEKTTTVNKMTVKAKKEKAKYKVHVDEAKCVGESCGCARLCTRVFRCPGLTWDKKAGKSKINTVLCAGCGVCVDVCPQGAIVKEVA